MGRVKRAVATVVAAIVNVCLIVLVLFLFLGPSALLSDRRQPPSVVELLPILYPATNVGALFAAFRLRGRSLLPSAAYYFNGGLAVIGLLFGLGSAIESTFSNLEQVATAVILIPSVTTWYALKEWRVRTDGTPFVA
jgi:hypothetical protein